MAGRLKHQVNPDGGESDYSYDTAGRLTEFNGPEGAHIAYMYDPASGLAFGVTTRDGATLTYAYDGNGRVRTATDAANNSVIWIWNDAGQLAVRTDLRGAETKYLYDDGGRVLTVAGPAGTVTYHRDATTGRITAMEGPGSRRADIGYDVAGRINSVTSSSGTISTTLNEQGQPLTITDSRGRVTRFFYDPRGMLVRAEYPSQQVATYRYDGLGRIAETVSVSGLSTTFKYEAENWIIQSDSLGRISRLQMDWRGVPVTVVDPDGYTRKLTYDLAGRLVAIQSNDRVLESYRYDSLGHLLSRTDGAGKATSYTYDHWGRILSVRDRRGKVTTFTYHLEANTVTVKAPVTAPATFTYDKANRLVTTVDPAGVTTSRTFTPEGNLESVTRKGIGTYFNQELTAKWQWHYDEQFRVDWTEDPLGHKTTYSYDPLTGLLVAAANAMGETTRYTYDTEDRINSATTPAGGVIRYAYHKDGLLKEVKDLTGGTWEYVYDTAGRLLSQVDPVGRTTTLTYTGRSQVASVSQPGNDTELAVTSYDYDADGRLVRMTDPLEKLHQYDYDAAGRLIKETNPLDQIVQYSYDEEGNLLTAEDPAHRITAFFYDDANRVASQLLDHGPKTDYTYDLAGRLWKITVSKSTTQYGYDGLGRIEAITDPLGRVTAFSYDGVGNLLASTDAMGKETKYSYDAVGRLLQQEDRLGHKTTYAYNVAEGIVTLKDREGNDWTYQYDPAGLLRSLTDPLGRKTEYTYDEAGRPVRTVDPLQNTRSLTYDAAGNVKSIVEAEELAVPHLVNDGINHEDRVQSFSYDKAGRMVTAEDMTGLVTAFAYDDLDRRVSASWPSPEPGKMAIESWTYYADNRVKTHTTAAGGTTAYEYDQAGRVKKVIDPNQFVTSFEYNELGQVTAQTDRDGTTGYEYDLTGNLMGVIDPRPERFKTTYVYDDLNRLTQVEDAGGGTQQLEYDAEGRVTRRQDGRGEWWTYAYDREGRLTSATDPLNRTTAWAYTPTGMVGSITDALRKQTIFTYDELDRLVAVQLPGMRPHKFSYDWRSNRIGIKDPAGNMTRYAYDKGDRLVSITDPMNGVTSYQWDDRGGLIGAIDANGNATSYERDAMGRVISETDPTGSTTRFEYDLAGNLAKVTNPLNQTTNYSYNQRGQVLSIDYDGQDQASFGYDAVGNLTRAANGATIERYGYDALSRLVSVTNETMTKTTAFAYDKTGNRTSITDPEGRITGYAYDPSGLLSSITLPEGEVVNYSWDELQRLTEVRRPNGVVTSYSYDEAGQISSMAHTGPNGVINTYGYTYDANGNKLTQTESDGAVTKWQYDALNRLTQVDYPKDKIQGLRDQYMVQPKQIRPTKPGEKGDTDPSIEVSVVQYAPQRTVWAQSDKPGKKDMEPAPAPPTTDEGGGKGNGNGGNQSNGSSTEQNNGNAGGQGNGNAGSQGNGNAGSQSNGNAGGQSNSNAGGQSNSNAGGQGNGNAGGQGNGNAGGQGNGNAGGKGNGNSQIDKDSRCKAQPNGNSKKQADSGWKAYTEVPDYLLTPVASVTYTYDKVGNRLTETRDGTQITYQYDPANHLLSSSSASYRYDAAGNLISKVDANGETQYTYSAASKLTKATMSDESYVSYAYDAFGRTFQRTESVWTLPGSNGLALGRTEEKGWGNNENRPDNGKSGMGQGNGKGNDQGNDNGNGKDNDTGNGKGTVETADCPDETTTNQGNAGGHGNGKDDKAKQPKLKLSEETTSYLYDGLSLDLLKEYKGLSASKAEYYYANGQVLGRKMFGLKGSILPDREPGLANGGTYYYLTDALGSVTELVDQHGAVARQYRYDAFGGLFTGEVGPYNTFGLTGKTYDAKSGLMDYGARWYDPVSGRFTQADSFPGSMDQPMSQNRYAYTWNNPVNYTDPTGHETCTGIWVEGECRNDVIDFDVRNERDFIHVPYVTRVEPDYRGYWEYGFWVDLHYIEVWLTYITGNTSFWRSFTSIEKYYDQAYENFVRTGPSDEEIRQEDDAKIYSTSGNAPPTFYSPAAKQELQWGLEHDWAGYTRGHSGLLNVSYVAGEDYSTHPLVSEAKYMLRQMAGFPEVNNQYDPLVASYIKEFQWRTGLLETPGVQSGVLDELTFAALKQTFQAWNMKQMTGEDPVAPLEVEPGLTPTHRKFLVAAMTGDSVSMAIAQVQCNTGLEEATVQYCSKLYDILVENGAKVGTREGFLWKVQTHTSIAGFERETPFAFNPDAALAGFLTSGLGTSSLGSKGTSNTKEPSGTKVPAAPKLPVGLSSQQYESLSKQVRQAVSQYGDDIVVQGSRASGSASSISDLDIAIRVTPEQFDEIVAQRFGQPNPGSAKSRTMEWSMQNGIIQRGELGLRWLGKTLEGQLGIDVDISVVRIGGPFDNGPFIPLLR